MSQLKGELRTASKQLTHSDELLSKTAGDLDAASAALEHERMELGAEITARDARVRDLEAAVREATRLGRRQATEITELRTELSAAKENAAQTTDAVTAERNELSATVAQQKQVQQEGCSELLVGFPFDTCCDGLVLLALSRSRRGRCTRSS